MLNEILYLAMMSLLVVGVIPFSTSTSASATLNSLNIFPPGSNPYGLSYSDHVKGFWKWILAIPANNNPFTGANCAIGQSNTSSPVFYLAPNDGAKESEARICEVPAGKGLFIPVMHVEYSIPEVRNGTKPEELAGIAKNDQDRVNSLYLKVDDREYMMNNLTKYRTQTGPFKVTFADPGIFSIDSKTHPEIFSHNKDGKTDAAADGYYIITEPIPKGSHTIHFKSSMLPDQNGEGAYATDITYKINAK